MAKKRAGRPTDSTLVLARVKKPNTALIKKAIKDGFIRRVSRGVYAVPVSLPSEKLQDTRTVSSCDARGVLSLKGVGRKHAMSSDKGKGEAILMGFHYKPGMPPTHKFQGGLTEARAVREASAVEGMSRIFNSQKRLDPVLRASRERFGLNSAPTFRVAGYFKPLQGVIEFRKGEGKGSEYERLVGILNKRERAAFDRKFEKAKPGQIIVVRAERALELAGIPLGSRRAHTLLLKHSVSRERLSDYPQLFSHLGKPYRKGSVQFEFWRKKFQDFGFTLSIENGQYRVFKLSRSGKRTEVEMNQALESIMAKFSAGLANGIHIVHHYMNASFTEKRRTIVISSLQRCNLGLGNKSNGVEIHDLETVGKHSKNLRALQEQDLEYARDRIRDLAQVLGKGQRAFRGEARLGFTSKHALELYRKGIRVLEEQLALGNKKQSTKLHQLR